VCAPDLLLAMKAPAPGIVQQPPATPEPGQPTAGSLAGAAFVAGLVAFTVWPLRTACIATSGLR
jgi:hypothetical protein